MMKFVDQTITGNGKGNCFNACVASVLNIPIESLPKYWEWDDDGWLGKYNEYLAPNHGVQVIMLRNAESLFGFNYKIDTYHIIVGYTNRDPWLLHSVIGYNGKVVHDPHSSREGLSKIEGYLFFIKVFNDD